MSVSKDAPTRESNAMKPRRILRPAEAWQRLGCGHSHFYKHYVANGLITLIPIAAKARGVLEQQVDDLIERMFTEAEAKAKADKSEPPPKRLRGRPRKHAPAPAAAGDAA